MSDREKYRTRGGYYLVSARTRTTRSRSTARSSSSSRPTRAGVANLAASYFYKRDMARALAGGPPRRAAQPAKRAQRNNLGLDAMYAGDFATAIKEQDEVIRLNPKFVLAYVSKAMSQVAHRAHRTSPHETWQKAAAVDARGASVSSMGLADIAMYQGTPRRRAADLQAGIEADISDKDSDSAAVKLLAAAETHLDSKDTRRSGRGSGARDVARPAERTFSIPPHAFSSRPDATRRRVALATELAGRLEPDPQAYAELIRGEAELARGKPAEAIRHFTAAQEDRRHVGGPARSWARRIWKAAPSRRRTPSSRCA